MKVADMRITLEMRDQQTITFSRLNIGTIRPRYDVIGPEELK